MVVGATVVVVDVTVVVGVWVVAGATVVDVTVVVGVCVVVGATVVVVDVTVVVGASVVVGALGAAVSGSAVSVAPPEQAETNMARIRNPAALRFMIRVCHPLWSGTQ